MHYRVLGRTGIRVSEIGLGAWVIGTDMYVAHDRERDIALIRTALDLGINTFDTADMYGEGLSEKILGEALRGYDVNVFTKVGYEVGKVVDGRHVQNFSINYIVNAVKESYNRLGRRITLLQLHNPPINIIKDRELHKALLKLVEESYVEHIGVALGPETNILNEGLAAIDEGYEAIMFVFNILEQEPGRTLIRRGVEDSIGLITRVPHASNVLTERQDVNFGPSDHRNLRSRDWVVKALEFTNTRIRPMAKSLGIDLETLAIKYILSYPVSTVMVTATSPEELTKYANAADGNYLSSNTVKTLENLYEEFTKLTGND